ncbi:MAG: hypothetical protein AAF226_15445, partial [Verrucomicrobiota bacterium]
MSHQDMDKRGQSQQLRRLAEEGQYGKGSVLFDIFTSILILLIFLAPSVLMILFGLGQLENGTEGAWMTFVAAGFWGLLGLGGLVVIW